MKLLKSILAAVAVSTCYAEPPTERRFYPDDPVWQSPAPVPVTAAKLRRVGDIYDVFYNLFGDPGEHHPEHGSPIAARGVNTLGEVPDSEWYINRHYRHRLTLQELAQGPVAEPPARKGAWTVVAAKTEGITPGFTILDATGRRFVLKFDPAGYPELATAADVISSRFFHAFGYYVPVNHIVYFKREDLSLSPDIYFLDGTGRRRRMTTKDLWDVLGKVHKDTDGRYRAVASLYLTGTAIGPRRWHGTRRDDPNDTIPHEHRRDLRGMRVFAAWLGHDDSRAINSLDVLQDEPSPHVRHYLIDFGSTLGSASSGPNSPRSGHVPFFSWKQSMQEFFTFGLYVPSWSMARYPAYRSVGRIEHERFAPERWVPEYPNPAFENMLPDDAFWAAKQVANFTDEEIRTVVRTGQISDADAEAWLVDCLIRRRDKISRAFFHPVLPLDRFRVENDTLMFEDVGEKVLGPARYTIRWAGDETGPRLPAQPRQGEVLTANIEATDGRSVSVDLIGDRGKARVVGITRTWRPGKNAKHVKLVGTR